MERLKNVLAGAGRRTTLAVLSIGLIAVGIGALLLAGGGDGGDDGSNPGTSAPAVAPQSPPSSEREFAVKYNRVVTRVQRAAVGRAPEVAAPIISSAQSAGRITAAEAGALRRAARALARGTLPQQLVDTVDIDDRDVRAVVRKSFVALKRRAGTVASPILERAVDRGDISRSDADGIRRQVADGFGYALP